MARPCLARIARCAMCTCLREGNGRFGRDLGEFLRLAFAAAITFFLSHTRRVHVHMCAQKAHTHAHMRDVKEIFSYRTHLRCARCTFGAGHFVDQNNSFSYWSSPILRLITPQIHARAHAYPWKKRVNPREGMPCPFIFVDAVAGHLLEGVIKPFGCFFSRIFVVSHTRQCARHHT